MPTLHHGRASVLRLNLHLFHLTDVPLVIFFHLSLLEP